MGPYAWQTALDSHNDFQNKKQVAKGKCVVSHGAPLQHDVGTKRARVDTYQSASIPPYLQHEDLRKCSRTVEVFEKIMKEPHMSISLPRPGATAGRVLEHTAKVFEGLSKKFSPMTFKFGITHDPVFRWYHVPYGYKHTIEKFDRMVVVYAASNPFGPAFLEASLIQRYGSCPAVHSKAPYCLSSNIVSLFVCLLFGFLFSLRFLIVF